MESWGWSARNKLFEIIHVAAFAEPLAGFYAGSCAIQLFQIEL